jgi:hypothetical protein
LVILSTLPDGPHSDRFELLSRLGEGSMGVVFEALDRERKVRVALKTLRFMDAEMLARFKREFRALQDLHHPNLVNLGELIEEGGHWFYTMELVDGVHFLEWVRENGELQVERLRKSLPQLAAGLFALHGAGKVHRDVKPSNIVVTRDGRVVLLDFGLVVETGRNMSITRSIVGTAAYMAPEQATSRPVGPEADWYSFGSMLYEALTGHVPFEGMPLEVLARKQSEDPRPLRELTPDVPADLADLTIELLAREPSDRPRAEDVLARLGVTTPHARRARPTKTALGTQVPIFVGRRRELALLREARSATRDGHPVSVVILGESGVGKSVLARHFAEQLLAEEPETVLLDARCFERETVHYKAADGIIDALARFMAGLPQRDAAAILPLKIGLLTQVFPALLRVEAVARAPLMHQYVKDPIELRARVFSAFRDLLARLCERRPVVVLVDDLQWADADSLALLAAVLRPPSAPGLLLIATARKKPAGIHAIEGDVRELPLDVLPQDQASDLAAELAKRLGVEKPVDTAAIAREAGGHALLIDELVRHVVARGPALHGQRLEDALWARIRELPEVERKLLEVVAVAGTPLQQQTAAVAAGIPPDEVARSVNSLRFANLVRTSGARAHDAVEPFHGRIRDTLIGYLSPHERKELHRRLAIAFEATDREDDESLAVHWAGAEEPERAAAHAERAAERAMSMLAFDRAARLYKLAIELGGAEDHVRAGTLANKLGDALANAGMGSAAAEAFLTAASYAKPSEAPVVRRRAADQLLRSGHIDEGVEIMRGVLAEQGWSLSPTPRRALLSLVARRAQLRLRGLGFRERDESRLPAAQLARIDACWSIAQGLSTIDFIRSADYQARHMLLALQAGEPYRLTRAFAMEAGQSATAGGKSHARTQKLAAATEKLAERSGHPHAQGMVPLMHGLISFLEGRWRDCWRHCDRAEVVLRERCTDVTWELSQSRMFAFWSLLHLGDLVEAQRRHKVMARESVERGDRQSEVNVTVGFASILWLVRDDAAAGRRAAGEAMSRWSHAGFQVQHCFDHYAASQADLYSDDAASAYRRMLTAWPMLEDSQLLRVQLIRVWMLLMRASSAIALASSKTPGPETKRLLAQATRDMRGIAGEGMAWSTAIARTLQALIAAANGQAREAAEIMADAATQLDKLEMRLLAAAARRRIGEWKGGADGAALIADAEEWMRSQGVRKPDRLAWALLPGGFHAPWRDTVTVSGTTRRNPTVA